MQWFLGLCMVFCTLMVNANFRILDSDNDGIPDVQEILWGSDPAQPDLPEIIYTFPENPAAKSTAKPYDPKLDIRSLAMSHIAEDRYLFRATFVEPPIASNLILHLYFDSDNNPDTGRKSTGPNNGTDHMLSFSRDKAYLQLYNSNHEHAGLGNAPYSYFKDNDLYMVCDIPLKLANNQLDAMLYILCHSASQNNKVIMQVSSQRFALPNIPMRPDKKIIRMADRTELFGLRRSYGMESIKDCLFNHQDNIFVPHDQLELDGFEINQFTSDHLGNVKSTRQFAAATTTAPKGDFHPGFVVFDYSASSKFALYIDGIPYGVAPINIVNRRYWVYWLKDKKSFTGKEKIDVIACGPYTHQLYGICFLTTPPSLKNIPYNIHNFVSWQPPESSGETILSWITEMPSLTSLSFTTPDGKTKTLQKSRTNTVHKITLSELDPNLEYIAVANGIKPDGTTYTSEALKFKPLAPLPPPATSKNNLLQLTVNNPHPFVAHNQLIVTGIPFPKTQLAHANQVRVLYQNQEIAAQIKTTAWWDDYSVKWILISFIAEQVPAGESVPYTLQYGSEIKSAQGTTPLASMKNKIPVLPTQPGISFNTQGELLSPTQKPCVLNIELDGQSGVKQAGNAIFNIEANGPIHAVIKVKRQFVDTENTPALLVESRYTVWHNSPAVRIQQTYTIQGKETFTLLRKMSLTIPHATQTWNISTATGKEITLNNAGLHQRFDNEFLHNNQPETGRLLGGATSAGGVVALRNFWQNYPKAFKPVPTGLELGLCPPFENEIYDAFPFEKEGHHLYFYLLNGVYKFKSGMAKTDDILLAWHTPHNTPQELAQLHQRPLLAVAPPEWYCRSGAFYAIAPSNTAKFAYYEKTISEKINLYETMRDRKRDYGLMNFGDWYGERGSNWGNSEYDTQSGLLLEFIRSGNEKAFFLAEDMELHNRDIDTVHWSVPEQPNMTPGAVMIHQIGHVGGYYTNTVPGTLGFPRGGTSVSHAWNEGHFYHYFLTGDIRSQETAIKVADYYIESDLNKPYHFTSCRVPGWHLIMNAVTLAATGNPYYLNASKVIIDRVLELQDKVPVPLPEHQWEADKPKYQIGGWSRMMVPGHCFCIPRHRGNANFMVAVLLSGMKYYHDVTNDPQVKEAIINGAQYLVRNGYSEEVKGFRYTSCPDMKYRKGTYPLMIEGIARAWLWTRDPELEKTITQALLSSSGGSSYGKGFSSYYRIAPRVLADMEAGGLEWNNPPPK